MESKAVALALQSAVSMMDDTSDQAELLLQLLSNSPTKRPIDSAVGDLSNDSLGDAQLSYLRYDVEMNQDWLQDRLGLNWDDEKVKKFQAMDSADSMAELKLIGQVAGEKLVQEDHFSQAFDLPN